MKKSAPVLVAFALTLLAAPFVFFGGLPALGSVAHAPPPPVPQSHIEYSLTTPTNQDVTVTLVSDQIITITNNNGLAVYTFKQNGDFVFAYKDSAGRAYTLKAVVNNIDKEAPAATLLQKPDATTGLFSATFVIGGDGVTAYRYRLDGGEWSAEVAIASPINLNNLLVAKHSVEVIGRDAVGNWQATDKATRFDWEILAPEKFRARTVEISRSQKDIEVSISQQHLWAYDGNTLVADFPVTTGASALGRATEQGTFAIIDKNLNKWFEGGFFSKYWMRFNKGMGLHDASWRKSFGGQDYVRSGSHGCVNVPPPQMPWLYEWAPVGTTVKVFW